MSIGTALTLFTQLTVTHGISARQELSKVGSVADHAPLKLLMSCPARVSRCGIYFQSEKVESR